MAAMIADDPPGHLEWPFLAEPGPILRPEGDPASIGTHPALADPDGTVDDRESYSNLRGRPRERAWQLTFLDLTRTL